MAPKNLHVTCSKCLKKVLTKNSIQCSLCKATYDLVCSTLPEKLFDLMGKESKAAWKCTICLRNKQSKNKITAKIRPKGVTRDTSTPTNPKTSQSASIWSTPSTSQTQEQQNQPNDKNNTTLSTSGGKNTISDESINVHENTTPLPENEYVTKRKPITNRKYSLDLSDHTELTLNTSFNSMPDLSIRADNIKIQELELEISELKMKLLSADTEIENLLYENCKLERRMKEIEKKNRQYQNMYIESLSTTKKKLSRKTTKPRTENTREILFENSLLSVREVETTSNVEMGPGPEELQSKQPQPENINNCEDENTPPATPTNETSDLGNTKLNSEISKRLLIFGGAQCIGLSSRLIKSRLNSPYDKYDVRSFIKPNASSEEILKTCKLYNVSQNDFVILSVGEHDCNPITIMTELSAALKSLTCNVLILRVQNNLYLNEQKLNEMLKLVIKNYSHCKFVDLKYSAADVGHNMHELCMKLNLIIDQVYYDAKFLDFKKAMYLRKSNLNRSPKIKIVKGTIPYFFNKMKSKIENTKIEDIKTKSFNDALQPDEHKATQPLIKKGTIPCYFPIITNKLLLQAKTKECFRPKQ